MNAMLFAAREAARLHKGVFRKNRKEPYFNHVARVAGTIAAHKNSTEDMVAAAYLHDTAEDCFDPAMDGVIWINEVWGKNVGQIVYWLTNASQMNPVLAKESRSKRKEADLAKLGQASKEAKLIKLADRLDNLRSFRLDDDHFMYKYAGETISMIDVVYNKGKFEFGQDLLDEVVGEVNLIVENKWRDEE